jgi:hypothetical protein
VRRPPPSSLSPTSSSSQRSQLLPCSSSSTGRTTNNSQSQFFLGQHGSSSSGDEQLLSPGQAGAGEASTGSPTLLDEGLHGDDSTTTTTATTSTSTKASAGSSVAPGLNGDRLEAAKKQFISLVCSFTSPDELSAFSLFAAHVLYQQRAVLAKGPSTYDHDAPPPPTATTTQRVEW